MQYYNEKLPDLFLRRDGSHVTTAAEWPEHAAALRELAAECYYGVWPGKPEALTARVITSEKGNAGAVPVVRESVILTLNETYDIDVTVVRPDVPGRVPVFVYNVSPKWPECPAETAVVSAGYAVVTFNREQLAPDLQFAKSFGYLEEAQSRAYPQLACGTIMTWAWGHSLVADWLETTDFSGALIATGHSRGGKAALCAGVFDERFAVVAPIGSGCGGTGCARFLGNLAGSRQDPAACETIGRMAQNFPEWMGPNYASFGANEAPYAVGEAEFALPIDAHTLRAVCAPRAVFSSDGADDSWANTFGVQLCWQASQPVFDLLGVPERNAFHMRPGGHAFNEVDWLALVDFCDLVLGRERHFRTDFDRKAYDIDLHDYADWT